MESGANPNIGYHNPAKSSAYGTYGITAPQYQEIQQQNPAFANRPITSLTPQEQGQANMASRDVYARQLAAKGVDPTEENIRMAHLLGAGGTNQYLRDGTFNQAAIQANQGEANLRRMVEQRRAGPVAPGQPQARPQPMIAGKLGETVKSPHALLRDFQYYSKVFLSHTVNRGPLVLRKSMLEELGYLDEEHYVLGDDEHDLFARAWVQKKWRCGFVPIEVYSPLEWGSTRKARPPHVQSYLEERQSREKDGFLKKHINTISFPPSEIREFRMCRHLDKKE
jgi:hypothetical protein